MSIFAIGDLQGCATPLQQLISKLALQPSKDQLWFAGDLVNRGPDSHAVLNWLRQQKYITVLGNHDLHLLAVANGIRPPAKRDTLTELLQPASAELLDWLRQQPLAHFADGHLLVHAGVLPQWSLAQTMDLAAEVEEQLRGPDYVDFLAQMYGNQPDQWHSSLKGVKRWRVIVNALTRIRFCTADGVMDFSSTEGAANPPGGFMPWFDVSNRQTQDVTVVFGHWSTLGLTLRDNLIGLDTGCVWGGKLSAVKLTTDPGQREVFQVDCPAAQQPG